MSTPGSADPPALPRHTLVWLGAAAHRRLADAAADALHRDALDLWSERDWPLVIRRFDDDRIRDSATVALGLPLPPAQGRHRLRFSASRAELVRHAPPPALAAVAAALPPAWRRSLADLDDDARRLGIALRVVGSAAWQSLTGLAYVTDASDLDLLLRPATPSMLDAAVRLLERWQRVHRRRADGEILFPGEDAVAWKEWRAVGGDARVLAKNLSGATLVSRAELLARLIAADRLCA